MGPKVYGIRVFTGIRLFTALTLKKKAGAILSVKHKDFSAILNRKSNQQDPTWD